MVLWSRVIKSRELLKLLDNGKHIVRKMNEIILIALVEKKLKKMMSQVSY